MLNTKLCIECQLEKPRNEFRINRQSEDGKMARCKSCTNAFQREGHKRCSKCHEVKPVGEFYNNKRTKDGLKSSCKVCDRANSKKRYEKNHSRKKARTTKEGHKCCSRCHEVKPFSGFYKNKKTKDGRCSWCKSCRNAYKKKYHERNRPPKKVVKEGHKCCSKCKQELPFSEFHKNKGNKNGIASSCKSCSKKYYEDNREQINEKARARRNADPEAKREYERRYRQENPEIERRKTIKWQDANVAHLRNYQYEYVKNRKQTDPLFASACAFRSLTYSAYSRGSYKKGTKTETLLGGSFEKANAHMEERFQDGMSWANHGEWHIDHIIPVCLATSDFELRTLCHYTNLQPMWGKDNLSKHAKVDLATFMNFLADHRWAFQKEEDETCVE